MSDFNQRIIEEFRANRGHVTSAGFGSHLVLLHTRGARTGAERVNPLMAIPTGDGWLVAASAGGAPANPAWYHNLRLHPQASVETGADTGIETVEVTATDLTGDEHAAAWQQFVDRSASFTSYQERAGRRIPVMRLSRRSAG